MSAKGNFNRLILTTLLCLLHPALCLHAEKDDKLTGTVMGTDEYYDPDRDCISLNTHTREEAFDGDLSTFVSLTRSRTPGSVLTWVLPM